MKIFLSLLLLANSLTAHEQTPAPVLFYNLTPRLLGLTENSATHLGPQIDPYHPVFQPQIKTGHHFSSRPCFGGELDF